MIKNWGEIVPASPSEMLEGSRDRILGHEPLFRQILEGKTNSFAHNGFAFGKKLRLGGNAPARCSQRRAGCILGERAESLEQRA